MRFRNEYLFRNETWSISEELESSPQFHGFFSIDPNTPDPPQELIMNYIGSGRFAAESTPKCGFFWILILIANLVPVHVR